MQMQIDKYIIVLISKDYKELTHCLYLPDTNVRSCTLNIYSGTYISEKIEITEDNTTSTIIQ